MSDQQRKEDIVHWLKTRESGELTALAAGLFHVATETPGIKELTHMFTDDEGNRKTVVLLLADHELIIMEMHHRIMYLDEELERQDDIRRESAGLS